MRIVRFLHEDGNVYTGVRDGDSVHDMGQLDPLMPFTAAQIAAAPVVAYDESKLEVPLARVPKLMALAGNYAKHIAESGFSDVVKKVWTPQIFWKPSTALLRHGGTVYLRKKNVFFDWEAELAVVIGKEGRDIPREQALDHVFGYTITNDLSERKFNSTSPMATNVSLTPSLIGWWASGSTAPRRWGRNW